MSAVESTRRDLPVQRDWVMVPVGWSRITPGDVVLSGRDGLTWHVVGIERHYATALVRLSHGTRQEVAEVGLDDPVHVLDDSTGQRYTEHMAGAAVYRPGA